ECGWFFARVRTKQCPTPLAFLRLPPAMTSPPARTHHRQNDRRSGPNAGSTPSPASIAYAMLEAQNAIRARVGIRPPVWSGQLTQVAQDWTVGKLPLGTTGRDQGEERARGCYL